MVKARRTSTRRILSLFLAFTLFVGFAAILQGVENTANAATDPSDYLADGERYYIVNRHSGLFLTTQNAGTSSGTQVVQDQMLSNASQRWKAIKVSGTGANAEYRFVPEHAQNLSLYFNSSGSKTGILASSPNTPNVQSTFKLVRQGANIDAKSFGVYKMRCKESNFANAAMIPASSSSFGVQAQLTTYVAGAQSSPVDEWAFVQLLMPLLATVHKLGM